MIKNIVFDIGGVLIDYSPEKLLDHFGVDHAGRVLLIKHVFASKLWQNLDRGVCGIEEAMNIISEEIPEYSSYVRRMFTDESLAILFTELEASVEFMRGLKKDGYMIYLLSNFSREGFDYVLRSFEFPSLADGMIISSHVGFNKPEPEIYQCLLDKYSLVANETLFFDDLEKNCRGAEALGINSIVFANLKDAEQAFRRDYL